MINCFILRDKLKDLYLTPFLKEKGIGSKDSEEPITWYSSEKINEEKRDQARLYCYKVVDDSVNLWIQEKRYFPRLLISSFTFLLMYFFLSLVIRDPLPIFDEIIGSFVAAVLMWSFITKKDKQSAIANKKKLEIKREVSNAPFDIIEDIYVIEQYLDDLRSFDIIDLADRITFVDKENLEQLILKDDSFFNEFRKLLKKQVFTNSSNMKLYFERILEVRKDEKSNEALSSRLVQLSRDAKIDLPLLALLVISDEYEVKVKAFIE